MEEPYCIDKPPGATPLEALGLLRAARPGIGTAKLAYAGRLDPMATGLLVVLHGALLARQEQFWVLPKEYETRVVLGLTTDSHDLLGLCGAPGMRMPPHDVMLASAAGMVGKHLLPVPVFSSARVMGKPLFALAKQHALPVGVPVRRMTVSEAEVLDIGTVSADELRAAAAARIPQVHGDFRQEAILNRWEQVLAGGGEWPAIRLRITCSGGTYVRSLGHELGRRTGAGAFVLDLRRTRVGQWRVDGPGVIRLAGGS